MVKKAVYSTGISEAFVSSHLSKVSSSGLRPADHVQVAMPNIVICEVALELEHVPHLVSAGETKLAVYIRIDIVIDDLFAKCFGKCGCHLRTSKMFACNSNGFANQLFSEL